MAEKSYKDAFVGLCSGDVRRLDEAVEAVEALRAASDAEDEAFAAWLRFDRDPVTRKLVVHGNTVKAAERRHSNAEYRAIDAVSAVERLDERIGMASVDVRSDELLAALKAVRDEKAAKVAALEAIR